MILPDDITNALEQLGQLFYQPSLTTEIIKCTNEKLCLLCKGVSNENLQTSSSKIKSILDKSNIKNSRYELTLYVVELLEILRNITENSDSPPLVADDDKKEDRKDVKLIGIKRLNAFKNGIFNIFYFVITDCLEKETSVYYTLTAASRKWKLFNSDDSLAADLKNKLLREVMNFLLSLLQIEGYGEEIWKSTSLEYICALLQLGFSPSTHAEKVLFRTELSNIVAKFDKAFFLQQLILIRSMPGSKSSNWFTRCCALVISKFIMEPNGVNLVIGVGLKNNPTPDWRKKEAIARIITLATIKDLSTFYELVGKQVVDLANETFEKLEANEDTEYNFNIFHITGIIIEQLADKNEKISQDYIFKTLITPLSHTTEGSEISPIYMDKCVGVLHKLYVETMSPNSHLPLLIQPVLCPLMKLASMDGITHIKSLSLQIIIKYLSQLSTDDCVQVLLIISELESGSSIPPVSPEISFEFVDGSVRSCFSTERDLLADDDRLVKCVVNILDKLLKGNVTRSYFANISKRINFTNTNQSHKNANYLYTDADKVDDEFRNFRTLSKVASLLSGIAELEKLVDDLFSDLEASHEFLSCLFKSTLQKNNDPEIIHLQQSLSLNVTMLLFSYLGQRVSLGTATRSDWNTLNMLLPLMKEMHERASTDALKTLLKELIDLILSNGSTASTSAFKGKNVYKAKCNSKFQETIDELHSPHVPIKGHGIIALTRLVRNNDSEAIQKKDTILLLFKHHLKNEDTYIYLAAIQGLATICDLFPDDVVPLLTKEFTDKQKLSTETRLKIIECLTIATGRLGEILPKYKNYFINSLLFGCRDVDELIRASSFSSLGEVCQHLHFALGPIVHEVLNTVRDAIECEKSNSVRRAGVLVLTLILRGIDRSLLKILNDVLLQIYRFLKMLREDPDEVIRLHAQVAMEEIDDIAKSFLIPKITMTKKIYITEVPPPKFI